MKIGSHEKSEIDQLRMRNAESVEHAAQFNQLRCDGPERSLTRKEFPS